MQFLGGYIQNRSLARVELESIAYQVEDLLRAMKEEACQKLEELRVDGAAAENNFLCQLQSNISSLPVLRTGVFESSPHDLLRRSFGVK